MTDNIKMVEGQTITIAGIDYVVPALNFKALKSLRPQIKLLESMQGSDALPTDEQFDAIVDVVLAAINRNYPSLDRDALSSMIDLGNAQAILRACLSASGVSTSAGKVTAVTAGEESSSVS